MSPENKWAIITGASSGIGKALTLEFAAGGFNVLLTGRHEEALRGVAEECASKYRVQTDVVVADLSRPESVDALIRAVLAKPREYGVLVNNAGFGIHGEFASTDIDENLRLVDVQLTAALRLTRAVLPSMISQHSGRILNVASVYSFAPVPFQSVYSACKSFLLSFSSSLQSELEGTGVTVTVFCPGVTQTNFRSRAGIREKNKDAGMPAEEAARTAFQATVRGQHIVVPGLVNRIFVVVAKLLPAGWMTSLVRVINRQRGQT
jgi:short-subunit dehydrogenase